MALSLDQRAGEKSAKFVWPFSGFEPFDIHTSRQVKSFQAENRYSKVLAAFSEIRAGDERVVLFYESFRWSNNLAFHFGKAAVSPGDARL